MTDLQVAITAAAVLAVIGVLAYNVRQQMGIQQPKTEPKREPKDSDISVDPDTLMPADPVVAPSAEPTGVTAPAAPEPQIDDWIAPSAAPAPPQPSPISEFADAIAVLRWDQPVPAERVWAQVRGWRRVGSKPMFLGWSCQPASGDAPRLSAEPDGTQVNALYVGVLMATRAGPLNAMEYSEWKNLLDQLARVTGARLEVPSMTDVLTRARALDQQCAAVDAQLSVCVSAKQVLSPSAIATAAQAASLSSTGESRFVLHDAQHRTLFSVFPGDGGNRLVLLLDVPRTPDPAQAFRTMSEVASAMARVLSAEVTDEAGKVIAPEALTVIERQIQSRVSQLQSLGIEPGSPLAMRLFL